MSSTWLGPVGHGVAVTLSQGERSGLELFVEVRGRIRVALDLDSDAVRSLGQWLQRQADIADEEAEAERP